MKSHAVDLIGLCEFMHADVRFNSGIGWRRPCASCSRAAMGDRPCLPVSCRLLVVICARRPQKGLTGNVPGPKALCTGQDTGLTGRCDSPTSNTGKAPCDEAPAKVCRLASCIQKGQEGLDWPAGSHGIYRTVNQSGAGSAHISANVVFRMNFLQKLGLEICEHYDVCRDVTFVVVFETTWSISCCSCAGEDWHICGRY